MKNLIVALLPILSFLAKPLIDRSTSGWSQSAWRGVTFFFIAVAVGYVLSQPPFWNKLRQPHSAVLLTTIVIVAAVSIIGAAFWTLIAIPLIPRQSELQLEVQVRRPYIIKRTGESDSWLAVFPSVVITSREEQKLTLSFRWLVPHRVGSDLMGATIDPYHELKVEAMGRPPAAWESLAADGRVNSDIHMPVPLDVGPLGSAHGYLAFTANGLDNNGFFIGQVGSISESLLTTTTLELRDVTSGLSKLVRVTGWEYIEPRNPPAQTASNPLPARAGYIRSAIETLVHEIRIVSGKQFREQCTLVPPQKLGAERPPMDMFSLTPDGRFTVVDGLRPLTTAFASVHTGFLFEPSPVGGRQVTEGYQGVFNEYQNLLSKPWVLSATKYVDGVPLTGDETFNICLYGLRPVDESVLERLTSALAEAESALRLRANQGRR